MANTIRIKRSTGSSAPGSLANAELAYAEGSNALYYGTGTGGGTCALCYVLEFFFLLDFFFEERERVEISMSSF